MIEMGGGSITSFLLAAYFVCFTRGMHADHRLLVGI